MTLNVPLSIRLGDTHITSDVGGVKFRKEAVGGVRNITLRLARPLDRVDEVIAYTRVYVYDARSATILAEGRLSDLGRSAGTDGQQWDLAAFGPAQHASDKTLPYIVIDQSLERWKMDERSVSIARGSLIEDGGGYADGHQLGAPTGGETISTTFVSSASYRAIYECGQKLGSVITSWRAGLADSDYKAHIYTRQGISGSLNDAYIASFATGTTNKTVVVVTDFPNGHDITLLSMDRQTTSTVGASTHFLRWKGLMVRALLVDKVGTEITTGYTQAYVQAHDVLKDLLGRVLDQYDGANASLVAGTYQIDQMAYPDGVTAAQVLDDLMLLEPAYRWTTGSSNSAGKYAFSWEAWPTTVRYEANLDDGGSFPASSQELFNKVLVRWRSPAGQIRTVTRTGACPVLDNAVPPVTRQAVLDLADEIGSATAATRAGDNFLAEHKYPNNAGTLTASRPIRDLTTGAMVEPFEIEPGELIRVRGVESYPDSLNASSNDGMTVFRIWSMEYDSDSNSAVLELDTYSRTTANALARLTTRRNRKR